MWVERVTAAVLQGLVWGVESWGELPEGGGRSARQLGSYWDK